MKIKLASSIKCSTLDLLHVKRLPAFSLPKGDWLIRAIGTTDIGTTNIYAQCGDYYYLLTLTFGSDKNIATVTLYQCIASVTADSKETWNDHYKTIGLEDIEVDGLFYVRTLGNVGDKQVALPVVREVLVTSEGTAQCSAEIMTYERSTSDNIELDKKELVYVAFERDSTNETAGISYYVGYALHPSTLTIL